MFEHLFHDGIPLLAFLVGITVIDIVTEGHTFLFFVDVSVAGMDFILMLIMKSRLFSPPCHTKRDQPAI